MDVIFSVVRLSIWFSFILKQKEIGSQSSFALTYLIFLSFSSSFVWMWMLSPTRIICTEYVRIIDIYIKLVSELRQWMQHPFFHILFLTHCPLLSPSTFGNISRLQTSGILWYQKFVYIWSENRTFSSVGWNRRLDLY